METSLNFIKNFQYKKKKIYKFYSNCQKLDMQMKKRAFLQNSHTNCEFPHFTMPIIIIFSFLFFYSFEFLKLPLHKLILYLYSRILNLNLKITVNLNQLKLYFQILLKKKYRYACDVTCQFSY
ncbi:hypothetical protein BpHYR1_032694 [Brachionus plicatilis]|uniref:Transmembrane protein n=1 Tax=Brachionus plicatilis TaxID=10195 RepID=A0A3M7Q427_BRAPC|nr:hypothetical protein BpHYR1_032694 [Brachionus plicatilis]